MDGLLIHGSGFDRSEGPRRAFAVHFVSSQCEDTWGGKTDCVKRHDPRADYRLVRGVDPHGHALGDRA